MTDFVILYEVLPRELESIIILGNELRCRGYSVEYVSFNDIKRVMYFGYRKRLKKLRNQIKVMLVPSCYHDKEMMELYYAPLGKSEKVVNLRWEQYFSNKIMDNPSEGSFLYPNEGAKYAYHVCWGEVSYSNMIAAGVPAKNLLKTGPIHMDILRDEFRKYYMDKKTLFDEYGLDSERKTVLFISSYVNSTDNSKYFKYLDSFFSGKYKVDYEKIDIERKSYALTLEWIEEFLSNHKDINFIWRPHPRERKTKELLALEEKYPYFKVISDYSVKQWILTCETVVTWVSTSIIEAFFADKPCFILRPVEYPYDSDNSVYRNACYITSKNEFMNILDTQCKNSLDVDYVHQCYDVLRDKPSYVRLADKLEEIYKSKDRFPWNDDTIRQFNHTERIKYMVRSAVYYLKKCGKRAIANIMISNQNLLKLSYGKTLDQRLENYKKKKLKKEKEYTAIEAILAPKVEEAYIERDRSKQGGIS